MKKIKVLLATFALAVGVMLAVPAPLVMAQTDSAERAQDGVEAIGGNDAANKNLGSRIKGIVNILLYILGAAAVIMIVIGGIRYTLSNGDSSAITSAKNTILYSVVGLVVALMAYAIVNFVLDSL